MIGFGSVDLGAESPRKEPTVMPRVSYSPQFKRKVVEDHLKGGKSVTAICREYRVSAGTFRRWREQYHDDQEISSEQQAELSRELTAAQQRIEELEGALGRATLEVDFMKRCFKRAGLPFPKAPRS
jgi:transposase-like protein